MQQTLEIAYDLTPDDLARSQRYGLPQGWILIVVFLVVYIGSISMTMLPSALRTGNWREMATSAGIPLVAVAVLYPLMLWLRGRRRTRLFRRQIAAL